MSVLQVVQKIRRLRRLRQMVLEERSRPRCTDRMERPYESLLDFIPRVTPRWDRPNHLADIANLFERILRGISVFALVSVPPQHGKTEVILHGIAWLLRYLQRIQIGYVTYADRIARRKSKLAQRYSIAAGTHLESEALSAWGTSTGGELLATTIGGQLTSEGLQLLIVDDPHKGRKDAESKVQRNAVHDFMTSTALPRVHPGGSVIVVHTRWHEDDCIGRLSKQVDDDGNPVWEVINKPAIDDSGNALWEKRRPISWLEKQRRLVLAYDWESLYMGRPRPRGAKVFRDVVYYEQRPRIYRVAIGVDCAYTSKTRADWSIAVVLAEAEGMYYVLDCYRGQVESPVFARVLKGFMLAYPGAAMLWYGSGAESGIAQHFVNSGVPLAYESAVTDKLVRATPVACAWNAETIAVPRNAAWLVDFLAVILGFAGTGEECDDDVDALAAAYDLLDAGSGRVVGGATGERQSADTGGF